jgi:hypothetical protein
MRGVRAVRHCDDDITEVANTGATSDKFCPTLRRLYNSWVLPPPVTTTYSSRLVVLPAFEH